MKNTEDGNQWPVIRQVSGFSVQVSAEGPEQ